MAQFTIVGGRVLCKSKPSSPLSTSEVDVRCRHIRITTVLPTSPPLVASLVSMTRRVVDGKGSKLRLIPRLHLISVFRRISISDARPPAVKLTCQRFVARSWRHGEIVCKREHSTCLRRYMLLPGSFTPCFSTINLEPHSTTSAMPPLPERSFT